MVGRKRKNKEKQDDQMPKELTPWQIEKLKYREELEAEAAREDVSDEAITPIDDEESVPLETEEQEPVDKWVLDESGRKTFKLTTDAELDKEIDNSLKKFKELPKNISFADKLPKMKERRKKHLKKRLLTIVGIFTTLALGLLYYVSPLSKVGEIKVVGNEKLASEHVINAMDLNDKKFIWDAYFDKKAMAKAKKENPRINAIERKLTGIRSLKLIVTEYPEVAYVKNENSLFPVLENGTVIEENVVKPENKFPLLVNFKVGEVLTAFAEKIYIVSSEVKSNIKEIHATPSKNNPYLITIYMNDGNEILASTRDYYEKINYYPSIAKQMDENGLVDMEAGVFSKSYATIAAEQAAKKLAADAEKIANGATVAPETGNVKDQVAKEDAASGMGYDKWLEKLQDGEIEDIISGTADTSSEEDDDGADEMINNQAEVENEDDSMLF